MKVYVIKPGLWAHKGIHITDIRSGEQDFVDSLAKELLDAGWASIDNPDKQIIEDEVSNFDREAAELEYKDLDGRARDDWSDDELMERIATKKAK